MTIDEAKSMLIAKANCIDNQCKGIYEDCNESLCDNCVLCYAQGTNGEQIKLLRQCAEWLEELKAIKSNGRYVQGNKAGQKIGYRSAIDDFIHECDKRCGFYTVGNKILTREDILLIAKQLKEGGK